MKKIKYKKLVLDYENILKKFPNAVKKLEEYFSAREDIMEGMKQIGHDPKESEAALTHFVGMIIQFDPRKLVDAFDYYGIFTNVVRADGEHWTYFVTDSPHSYSAEDRIEGEIAVFMEAMDVLNKI